MFCVVGCFGGGLLLLGLVAVSVGDLLYSGVYCWCGGLGLWLLVFALRLLARV